MILIILLKYFKIDIKAESNKTLSFLFEITLCDFQKKILTR